MSEKITNINESVKNMPIDRDLLLGSLQDVPDEIIKGYLEGIENSINELLVWKNIFTAGNKNVTRHILEWMNEDQIKRLYEMVLRFNSDDMVNKIHEITDITFNIEKPVTGSCEKTIELIDLIRTIGFDCSIEWKEFAHRSRSMNLLASAILLMSRGEEFEENLIKHFSSLPAIEFDGMFNLIAEKLKHQPA